MNHSEQKKNGYNYRREDLYNVTVYCEPPAGKQFGVVWLKYRNISVDKPARLDEFKKFIRNKFPDAKYMNVYGGLTGDYYKRVYL
jgi:hypothetical protein